jgi:hypothetical protein
MSFSREEKKQAGEQREACIVWPNYFKGRHRVGSRVACASKGVSVVVWDDKFGSDYGKNRSTEFIYCC